MKRQLVIIQHLYVHIPPFKEEPVVNDYFKNLTNELSMINQQYELKLKTLYLGSEITTNLTLVDLERLLQLFLPFTNDITEYSFECHFANINNAKMVLLKQFNVNRLVWKVITFQEQWTNKVCSNFNVQAKIALIADAIKTGFTNFSIDLKYHLPKQTITDITNDLLICQKLAAPHISYDSNNKTLNLAVKKVINNFLTIHNYDNYEYYSYCLAPQFQSQQTIAYCLLKNYYGLGPNATSYLKTDHKTWIIKNSNNIKAWIPKMFLCSATEVLQTQLMQGLLLRKGLSLSKVNQQELTYWQPLINKLIAKNQLMMKNQQLFCTNDGWTLLNEVLIAIITNNK